jgi:hypothetical protein
MRDLTALSSESALPTLFTTTVCCIFYYLGGFRGATRAAGWGFVGTAEFRGEGRVGASDFSSRIRFSPRWRSALHLTRVIPLQHSIFLHPRFTQCPPPSSILTPMNGSLTLTLRVRMVPHRLRNRRHQIRPQLQAHNSGIHDRRCRSR